MSGKSSRTKGHDFERLISNTLKALWPGAKRGLQTQSSPLKPPDVDGTPFYIECKKGKRTNIKAALAQATLNTDGRPPVAITRDDRKDILVTLKLKDFIDIVTGTTV